MEHLTFTVTDRQFRLEGFPDAVKIVRLAGPKAQRLADLALHKEDLDATLYRLHAINRVPDEDHQLREALWESAIVHFIKCFGGSESRFSLNAAQVYKGDVGALQAFAYFDSLRNKHLVHDDNSYTQCLVGAVLNKREVSPQIAKIIASSIVASVLGQENYQNLHLLATQARTWIVTQFDGLADVLTQELEAKAYEELLAMPEITYTAPGTSDVHTTRPRL